MLYCPFDLLGQVQILDAFRSKQSEETSRYNALLSHQRGHALVIRKKWRQLKQFLIGPRGSWAQRCVGVSSVITLSYFVHFLISIIFL